MARFRELRKEKHLTQEELITQFNAMYGKQYGVSSISMFENGKRFPETQSLIDFADFFGVSIDYLLGRTDIRNISAVPQQPIDINKLTPEQYQHIRYEIYKEEVSAIERERKSPPSSSLADDHQAELA